MAFVYLGVGSNINREHYIQLALDILAKAFGALTVSSVYRSEAIGFDGDDFYNLVVLIETDQSVAELFKFLRDVEFCHGRPIDATKSSGRTIDLDILSYDDWVGDFEGVQLPRAEILYNAFVLRPLAEIAPQVKHPVDGRTYSELWQNFDKQTQRLSRVS
jgi:2-amino-4-hydroxy-6-hydroxymethyldihydropteridine diphosphokinase